MAIVVTKMLSNLFAKYSDISAHVIGAWVEGKAVLSHISIWIG